MSPLTVYNGAGWGGQARPGRQPRPAPRSTHVPHPQAHTPSPPHHPGGATRGSITKVPSKHQIFQISHDRGGSNSVAAPACLGLPSRPPPALITPSRTSPWPPACSAGLLTPEVRTLHSATHAATVQGRCLACCVSTCSAAAARHCQHTPPPATRARPPQALVRQPTHCRTCTTNSYLFYLNTQKRK